MTSFCYWNAGPEEALKNAGEKPVKEEGETGEGETGEKKEEGDGDQQKKDGTGEGTGTADEVKRNDTAKDGEKKKPKVVLVKEAINAVEKVAGVLPLGDKHLQDAVKK